MTKALGRLNAWRDRLEQDPVWFPRYVMVKTVVVLLLILAMSAWASQNVVYQAF